ncbi:MAG: ROK family protein [Chloroflexia bacterium]
MTSANAATARGDGPVFGGIEAGGTKFVCAVGTGPDDVRAEVRFPTTTPGETIEQAVSFFREHAERSPLAAVGIASFGPVDPDPASPMYGYITSTPKPGWQNTDFAGAVERALGVPVGFDTDTNVAALGEHRWGAAQGFDTFIYLTVGTGIGGGGVVGGKPMHGLLHPEMGHIRIPHDSTQDPFPGACPFHGDRLEGLAAGPAMEQRWGRRAEDLPADHPAWALEARYLALALTCFTFVLSPQRIVMGGGIMSHPAIFPMIRFGLGDLLNGYLQTPDLLSGLDRYVVPPGLGQRSGVLGAIALAQDHYDASR